MAKRQRRKRPPEPGDDGEIEENVGYGQPPVHSRFKPGQSGNPKGRPKGKLTRAQRAAAVLERMVRVMENGKPKRISMEQLGLRKLAEKAASGDIKALVFLQSLAHQATEAPSEDDLSEQDKRILDAAVMRVLDDADADEDWDD